MSKVDRVRLIFWLTVILLVFGTFAAEAAFRSQICIAAMTNGNIPEVCR